MSLKHILLALALLAATAASADVGTPYVTVPGPAGDITIRLTDSPPPVGPSGSASGVLTMPPSTAFEINGGALMPAIYGFNSLRVKDTTELPTSNGQDGAFRIACRASHMGFFDPIVYPGVNGRSHLHTFFGNSDLTYSTNTGDLGSSLSRSTCVGGTMNRSAYWVPSAINTLTGFPVVPTAILTYYKTSQYYKYPRSLLITVPVPGLRMIAGSASNSGTANVVYRWDCIHVDSSITNTLSMPGAECENGSEILALVSFPNCWDGVNLDSPNHQAHMAYESTTTGCPATHPVPIPHVSFNVHYKVTASSRPENWRLSSDTYSLGTPAGRSMHGDWVNGWQQPFLSTIVVNCVRAAVDCHAHLLGDGRMIY